ncbi:hypothetical protein NL64_06150 [Pseudomonas fluorescens]|uniref:hypothetical protein n=1 Tax=Pseudomonas fluorescens TaxID=294 RepID=UPI00054C7000|nr:hypothetical protein [Pseudomonas fluorescens]KII34842.1 hypothetical protein NL64_06150 [Pseudomonas fluorescens]
MSYANFVQCQLTLPLSAAATEITVLAAVAPFQLPPTTGGVLILADSPTKPSQVEIIRYTARAGLQLTGVTRGQEGTAAVAWSGVAFCYQALTAGDLQAQLDSKANLASPAFSGIPTVPTAALGTNSQQASNTAFVQAAIANLIASAPGALDTLNELAAAMGNDPNFAATVTNALAGKEPTVVADTVNKFYAGTKTWRDLPTDVRAITLTGLSTATNAVITATDTVLSSLGKLQSQISDVASNFATNVRGTVLAGYLVGTNTAVAATDTVMGAFAKVQGQLNSLANSARITAVYVATPNTIVSRDVSGGISANHIIGTGSGNDFSTGGVEIQGNGAANTVFPTLGFHQPGGYAGSLQLRAANEFRLYNQGLAAYANLTLASLSAAVNISALGNISAQGALSGTNISCYGSNIAAITDGVTSIGTINAAGNAWRGSMTMKVNDTTLYFDNGGNASNFRILADGTCAARTHLWAGASVYQNDGNVSGAVWGGYLSNFLVANYMQIGNVITKVSETAPLGVGAYAFMKNITGTNYGAGTYFGGNQVAYTDAESQNYGTPNFGSWKAMGPANNNCGTIMLRVS